MTDLANAGGYLFGHADDGSAFAVSSKDRQSHMHVVGASGGGKSKFLEMLVRQDLHNRKVGGCVIDPHGLLVDDIMNYVSHKKPHLADKIVLFEPDSQTDNVVGFNPIPKDYDNIAQAVGEIIETILFAWGEHGERLPRIRAQLFNILYPILANDLTLVEAMPMINIHSKDERNRIIKGVDFAPVTAAWEAFERANNQTKLTLLEGPSNRFMRILANEHMRLILSQRKNSLDLAEIMAGRKMLLVSLRNYNRIGGDNLRMLGVMILSELFRVGMKRNERLRPPPFHVYIDEFGEYVTPAVAQALDQIRKKNVFFTVAHQHLAQLEKKDMDETLIKSVMTNCRLKVAFGGMEPHDADRMSKLFWTGHLDLKEKKHEQWGTKVRTRESTRTSHGRSRTVSDGTNQTEGHGTTQTTGYSDSAGWGVTEAEMKGWAKSDSTGQSEQIGWSQNQSHQTNSSQGTTKSHSSGASLSKGSSRADGTSQSRSNTTGSSETKSEAHTHGSSNSSSSSSSHSSGSSSSESRNDGHSTQFQPDGHGTTKAVHSLSNGTTTASSHNESSSSNSSESHSENESHTTSTSRGTNESRTSGDSSSQTNTKSMNHTTQYSDSSGESRQRGSGTSRGSGRSGGRGSSKGHTESVSGSKSYSEARTGSHTDSLSDGVSQSYSKGTSHTGVGIPPV